MAWRGMIGLKIPGRPAPEQAGKREIGENHRRPAAAYYVCVLRDSGATDEIYTIRLAWAQSSNARHGLMLGLSVILRGRDTIAWAKMSGRVVNEQRWYTSRPVSAYIEGACYSVHITRKMIVAVGSKVGLTRASPQSISANTDPRALSH